VDKYQNYKKGKNGEFIAKDYLIDGGYDLLEMNYKNKIGEIDLIMKNGDMLVFVEVKLKIGDRFGFPEEMIDKRKLYQIKRVAESFLVLKPQISKSFEKYRIDAVCVVLNYENKVERIKHYENLY